MIEDERGGIILSYGLEIHHARSNETKLIILIPCLTQLEKWPHLMCVIYYEHILFISDVNVAEPL